MFVSQLKIKTMPYKSENKKIEGTKYDRRRKLTNEDKIKIVEIYKEGNHSQRTLAELYKVSKRTIQFILDPKKLEENKKRRAERGGSMIYYDKDYQTEKIRDTRRYKQSLHLKNKI
jgi:transposase-like protein